MLKDGDNVVSFPPRAAESAPVAGWPTVDAIDEAASKGFASMAIDEAEGDYAHARRLLKRADEIVAAAKLERKADRILGPLAQPPGAA